jgi:uncharacterized SAM-binding protein YcdF (DUF218 family)
MLLLLSGILILFFWGKYNLFSSDVPVKADGILLLMGGDGDRAALASELYHNGYASVIWIINIEDEDNKRTNKNGVLLRDLSQLERRALLEKGVDSISVKLLSGPSASTFDEAVKLAEFIKMDTAIKKILVVTSAFHSGRADYIFEDVFKTNRLDVSVNTPPNPYSNLRKDDFGLNVVSLSAAMEEMLKWVYHICFRKTWFT